MSAVALAKAELPYTVARGGPGAPLRDRGSLAVLARVVNGSLTRRGDTATVVAEW